jgi:hypothetical protein
MCSTHAVGYIDNPDVYGVPCRETTKNSEYDVEKAKGGNKIIKQLFAAHAVHS